MRRKKAQHGDRVTHKTGAKGVLVDVHSPSHKAEVWSVLLDSGPRATVTWFAAEATWSPPINWCPRCEERDHLALSCPYGDCGAHLSEKARNLLLQHGYDPNATPDPAVRTGKATFDGRLLARTGRGPVYAQMRPWVDELDGVRVDGRQTPD